MPHSLLLSLIRNNGFVCCPSRTNFYVNSVIPCKGFLLDSESCKDFYRRAMDLPHYFSCYIVIHGLFELQLFLGFPGGSGGKETACYVGDPASIPGSGRSPGESKATHPVFLLGEFHGQRSLAGYSPRVNYCILN